MRGVCFVVRGEEDARADSAHAEDRQTVEELINLQLRQELNVYSNRVRREPTPLGVECRQLKAGDWR